MINNAVYDSLVLMIFADGDVEKEELNQLYSSIKYLRDSNVTFKNKINENISQEVDESFKRLKNKIQDQHSIVSAMCENGQLLSKLKINEKKAIVLAIESVMKSDDEIDERERETYAAFKKSINLDSGFWGIFKKLGRALSSSCEICMSTNVVNYKIKEIDRWRGRKEVTERLASGKTRTKNVSTTYVKNCYFWRCNECGAEWEIIRKEEK
ncbi:MAG: TerB family tellurite resistance protein [Desulfovibrio sp.]|nr:TerB family tellurite resistance protein [Desulfovibrio sp.]